MKRFLHRSFYEKNIFIFSFLLFVFLLGAEKSFAALTLNSNGTIAAGTPCQTSTKFVIQTFYIYKNGAGCCSYTMTDFYFTTTGTYATTDYTKFQLWSSTTNDITTATQVGTDLTSTTAGTQTFAAFSTTVGFNVTMYFWVTTDIATAAVSGRTIAVNALAAANFTGNITPTVPTTPPASGTQTITSAIPVCASGFSPTSGTFCNTIGTTLSWSAATCASSYKIYLDQNNPPTTLVSTQTGTSYATGALPVGTTYWKITPSSSAGDAISCTVQSFIISSSAPNMPGPIFGNPGVCNNSAGDIYSVDAQSDASSFTWTVPSGASITAGQGTQTITVTYGTTSGSVTVVAVNGCGSSAARTLAITVNAPGAWKGSTSTDWFNNANWCGGAQPTSATNVYLPSAPANQPKIDGANGVVANTKDLYIAQGSTLTIQNVFTTCSGSGSAPSAGWLQIYGDLVNNGKLTHIGGTSGPFTCLGYIYLSGTGTVKGHGSYSPPYSSYQGDVFLIDNGATYTLGENWPYIATERFANVYTNTTGSMSLNSYTCTTNGWQQVGTFNSNTGTLLLNGPGTASTGLYNITPATSTWGTGSTLVMNFTGGNLPVATYIPMTDDDDYYNVEYAPSAGSTYTRAANLNMNGYFKITSGTVDGSSFTHSLKGDWINNSTFTGSTSTVNFNGTATQSVTGTSQTTYNNLTINNTSGVSNGVSLNVTGATKGAIVTGALTLTNGVLNTTSTQLLTLNNAATSTIGSASSFVNGPMKKLGIQPFVFPVGQVVSGTGWWRRIEMVTAPAATTSSFQAQYFHSGYGVYTPCGSPTPVLTDVSKHEYWQLDKLVADASSPQIKLYWQDAGASGLNPVTITDLRVSHYNSGSSCWENNNDATTNSGSTSGSSIGTIATTAGVSTFSPFTFGTRGVTPLPVELLSFTADCSGDKVEANWQTATEMNSDYFTLEKSTDGSNFYSVKKVKAAGNSTTVQNYSAEDAEPFSASSYYRLSETDFNGQTKTFDMVPVKGCGSDNIIAFSNGNTITVTINSKEDNSYSIILCDAQGKIIVERKESFATEKNSVSFPVNTSEGIYFVKVYNDKNIRNQKLSIQK